MDTLEPVSVCLDVAYVDWTLVQYCPGPQVRAGNNPRANACLRSGFSPSYACRRTIILQSNKSLLSRVRMMNLFVFGNPKPGRQGGQSPGKEPKKTLRSF